MKGKNISGKDYIDLGIGGLATSFWGMVFNNDYENRLVKNTKNKYFEVDTIFAPDTNLFETGIKSPNFYSGNWIIVDQYRTKNEALKKHKEWFKFMKTNPNELIDIFSNKNYKFNPI
jgi:hypothetical protein